MATNYSRGAKFERKVKEHLESFGYSCVRSAGSHSPADVVGFRRSVLGTVYGVAEVVAVQCKRDGRLDPDEWNEFWEWSTRNGATPILARLGKAGHGTIYHRLTSRKDGRGRQPLAPWEPQEKGE